MKTNTDMYATTVKMKSKLQNASENTDRIYNNYSGYF